jgi:hypothetical protein
MDSEYKVLKLTNGDSVITEISSTSEKSIFLHRPMAFKTVMMMDENMNSTEVLLLKNWAEYSADTDIEVPLNSIMTSWKPDVLLLNCYEMEKIKQDAPEIYKLLKSKDKSLPPVNPNIMPMLPGMPGLIPPTPKNIPNNMANFNLNLPMDVAKQLIEFLESQGIDLIGPDFSDNDSSEDISDEEMIDELTEDQGFGNNLDDWSSDPQDYLK